MISHYDNRASLRARALTLAVATTGSITLAATTSGYARTPLAGTGTLAASAGAGIFDTSQTGVIVNGSVVTVAGVNSVVSALATNGLTCTLSGNPTFGATAFTYTGSFIVDGLYAGMEIVPTGFSTNTVGTITSVTARTITTGTRTAEAPASGRTLAVGLPQMRAWENSADVTFVPIAGRPYITEEYSPSTHELYSSPKQGGDAVETGMYVLKFYGITGTEIQKYTDKLALLYTPGTALAAGANYCRIRSDVSTTPGDLIPQPGGWTVGMIQVHWSANSKNVIAA